ncbi:MAG TPA: hypothetical protein VF096_00020 [Azonexus sp.]
MNGKFMLPAAVLLCCAVADAAPPGGLAPAEQAAAFAAAGFKQQGQRWRACDDPTASYVPGAIESVRDLNGDGRPEALITEGGSFCYGHVGTGYSLVSRQADGRWKLLTRGTGIVSVLETRGAGGWPDLEIGGPGFCFPVVRWDGRKYALHRHQYEGKPCRSR